MHILITMAGLGSRFRAKGFQIPKYQITAKGRTLFSWSMESLRNFFPIGEVTFVVRKEDDSEAFIRQEMATFQVQDPQIICLDQLTDGQATTVLMALPTLRRKNPLGGLLIYNIDTYVEPQHLLPGDVKGDGWIPCFPGRGDAWSFFRTDSIGRVIESKEKCRISDHASIGMYYFSSLKLFEATYNAFFKEGLPEGLREKYIAPMYQYLIDQGMGVWIHSVPFKGVHPLGTPEEVEAFVSES